MHLAKNQSNLLFPQGFWGSWMLTIRLIAFGLSCGIGFLVFCTLALAVILTPEQYIHVSYEGTARQTKPLVITLPGQGAAQTSTKTTPQDSNWDGAATGCGIGSLYGRFIPGAGPYVAGILGAVVGYELDRRF